MPDTVVLVVTIGDPNTQKIISKATFDKWSPSLHGVLTPPYNKLGPSKSITCRLNPSKKDGYMPRLTLYKRAVRGGFLYLLYIEFSAPKIIWNNNFTEIEEDDFDMLCFGLSYYLHRMGVNITDEELKKCQVKTIHYGKNIILTNYMTPAMIINHAAKANITLKKRVNTTTYLNGGRGLHIYTNEQGVCLYDKIAELKIAKQTEKGNIEKDSWCQLDMLKKIETDIKQPFQVIRLESRLGTKNAIRQRFSKLKIQIPTNPNFEDLFKADLGKAVILNELGALEAAVPPFIGCREPPEAIAEHLRILNPKAKARDIALVMGIIEISRNIGLRDTRLLIGAHDSSEWRYIKNKYETLKMPAAPLDYFKEARNQINDFEPVKLENYIK
ncbi:hypothetical protein IKF03_03335 [Candidatus Saccharibacteria bacterium]|nr:hypothetical protein [Candidatus Saccharibacteria bacterium]